jgi:flagellar basal body-associated protein FliL
MENVLLSLAVLACPVGMGLMMWFMAKGMRSGQKTDREAATSLEELQAEHRRLGAEIERLERDSSPRSVAETRR